MKMRELERRTGVNRETIRVYFRYGLLPEPVRPKANVADYNEDHVKAILAIRELQKSQRLPLNQIRRALEGDASVAHADVSVFSQIDTLLAARMGVDNAYFPLPSPQENPQLEADAYALEALGAIKLRRDKDGVQLSRVDLQLLSLWGAMRDTGFTPEHGFDTDIVSTYVEVADRIAKAEVYEFLSRANAEQGEGTLADMVQKAMSLMLNFVGLLRMKSVLRELHDSTHGTKARRRKRVVKARDVRESAPDKPPASGFA